MSSIRSRQVDLQSAEAGQWVRDGVITFYFECASTTLNLDVHFPLQVPHTARVPTELGEGRGAARRLNQFLYSVDF